MSGSLVRYDAMCRAIDAAYEVDEVKDIRDRAVALESYARQALNFEAEEQARKIRLRAERRVGQLLKTTEKAKGAREPGTSRGTTPSAETRASKTLAEMGITYDQSSDWQKLADVPEEEFEAALNGEAHPTAPGIVASLQPDKAKPVGDRALWLWGRLRDFERTGMHSGGRILDADPRELLGEMTEPMREDALRLAPLVADWIERISDDTEN